jgi:hypothetical protein
MKSHERVSRVLAKTTKNLLKVLHAYNDEKFRSSSPYPACLDATDYATTIKNLSDDVSGIFISRLS